MARRVRDTNLETRTARLRLTTRRKPYWRVLESGLHLGYRRIRDRSGTWVARRFVGAGAYAETGLGLSDDLQDADGITVLSFRDAQHLAREWWRRENLKAQGLPEHAGPYTVAHACEDYRLDYVARGGKAEYSTNLSITRHILPALGTVEVSKLTSKQIKEWHRGLATAPKRVRTKKSAKKIATKEIDRSDADAVRSRRSTANRILTILKAALNHAFQERHIASDEAWRAVKPFAGVNSPLVRYLTGDECKRLVNAMDAELRPMVQAALLTGVRYGELGRLQVADVNTDAKALTIRAAKAGKPRHVVLTDEAVKFFSPRIAGRPSKQKVFHRDDGGSWKDAQQTRKLREACKNAQINPPIGFHILRHTHGTMLAMKGVPMAVIAKQLGHADTQITEKHYAHLAPSYVSDTIRTSFPDLGIGDVVTSPAPVSALEAKSKSKSVEIVLLKRKA